MRLYDFSAYAHKRDVARSTEQIRALVPRLNEPGVVIEFKQRIEGWLILREAADQILKVR